MSREQVRTEVAVIGAGIIGVSAAFFLRELGRDVVLVERGGIGEESSGKNAGSMPLQVKKGPLIALCRGGIMTWREMDQDFGGLGFVQSGGLRVAETRQELETLRQQADARNKLGADISILTKQETRSIAPYLSTAIHGVAYCPWDSHCDALTGTQSIARAAMQRGVEIVEHSPVMRLEQTTTGHVNVITEKTLFRCNKVLLAAGAWTRQLALSLAVDIPTDIWIKQMLVTARSERIIKHMLTHTRGNLTLKQVECGSVLIGGGWIGDEARGISRTRFSSILGNVQLAARIVPDLKRLEIVRTWVGTDCRTSDGLPIIGSLSGKEGVYVAVACVGGYAAGPYVGKLVAQTMSNGISEQPLEPFSLSRFHVNGCSRVKPARKPRPAEKKSA